MLGSLSSNIKYKSLEVARLHTHATTHTSLRMQSLYPNADPDAIDLMYGLLCVFAGVVDPETAAGNVCCCSIPTRG
jgi:hypothetical protein